MKLLKSKLTAALVLVTLMFSFFTFSTVSVDAQVTNSDISLNEPGSENASKDLTFIVLQAGNQVFIFLIGNLRGSNDEPFNYPEDVLD